MLAWAMPLLCSPGPCPSYARLGHACIAPALQGAMPLLSKGLVAAAGCACPWLPALALMLLLQRVHASNGSLCGGGLDGREGGLPCHAQSCVPVAATPGANSPGALGAISLPSHCTILPNIAGRHCCARQTQTNQDLLAHPLMLGRRRACWMLC